MIDWLLCTECGNWWHAVCAKINDEDIFKFETYSISFVWAFCVLGIGYTGSTTVNKQTSDPVEKETKDFGLLNRKLEKLIAIDVAQCDGPYSDTKSTKAQNCYTEEQIVVIDIFP